MTAFTEETIAPVHTKLKTGVFPAVVVGHNLVVVTDAAIRASCMPGYSRSEGTVGLNSWSAHSWLFGGAGYSAASRALTTKEAEWRWGQRAIFLLRARLVGLWVSSKPIPEAAKASPTRTR